jgi:hypothetical protein
VIVRFIVRCFVGAVFVLSAQFANAQLPGGGSLPASEVAAFQANPNQVLNQFRDGGPLMVKQIRELLGSDKTTLGTIIGLARTANEDQRKAIAEGLAQIAKAYAANGDPGFANQIQQAVASSGIPELPKAYALAAGDTGTASTGGGGGGGGPSGAGAPQGGSNFGNFNGGSTFATNGTPNLLTGGGLGGGGFSQVSPF